VSRARIIRRLLAVAAALALASPALADRTRCVRGADVRTVEVVYADPGRPVPCEVLYAKTAAGTIESLWRAEHEPGYCEARATEFIAQLESLGLTCAPESPVADDPLFEPADQ